MALLLLPPAAVSGFLVLVVAELRCRSGRSGGHDRRGTRDHIAERYGLFTLIVLGETVLAASLAIQGGLGAAPTRPVWLAAAGSSSCSRCGGSTSTASGAEPETASVGLRALLVFASAAAVGAGLVVNVVHHTGEAHISDTAAGYAVAIPGRGLHLVRLGPAFRAA